MSRKVALIFPGQGAQSVGMGKELYDASGEAKAVFDKANTLIDGLTDVIFNGPQEKLTQTAFCQPAIFTYSMAVLEALKTSDKFQAISVEYACGLSLGEYGALCACGALGFEDTLKLIQKRGAFMDEACKENKGSMAAVIGMDKQQLMAITQEAGAEVANFNSPDQIVITGLVDKVQAASERLTEAGAKRVIPLQVAGGFHSSLMQSAADKFKEELANYTFQTPVFSIISNVDAKPTTDPAVITSNLPKQITSSVQWVGSVECIASQGVTTFLELGPGTVLKGLIRKINRDYKVYNIQKLEDIEALDL